MGKKTAIVKIICEECGVTFFNGGLSDKIVLDAFEEHCLINHIEDVNYIVERKRRVVN